MTVAIKIVHETANDAKRFHEKNENLVSDILNPSGSKKIKTGPKNIIALVSLEKVANPSK